MNIERLNRPTEILNDFSRDEVVDEMGRALDDPEVMKIMVVPNRHDRRKDMCEKRKGGDKASSRKAARKS